MSDDPTPTPQADHTAAERAAAHATARDAYLAWTHATQALQAANHANRRALAAGIDPRDLHVAIDALDRFVGAHQPEAPL